MSGHGQRRLFGSGPRYIVAGGKPSGTKTGSFSADAAVRKPDIAGTPFTADAVRLRNSGTKTFAADAVVLRNSGTKTFTADAVIFRNSGTKTFTADAVRKASSGTKTFTADAVRLANSGTKTFTANAVIYRNIAASFTANAAIYRNMAGSLTANAVIKTSSGTKTFTADAVVLRSSGTQSLTANAIILKSVSGKTFPLDATIARLQTSGFNADAVIFKAQSGSFNADAVIARAQSGSFNADAVIAKTRSASFTADAFVRPWFTIDARIAGGTTGSFSVDAAIKRNSGTKTFTADGIQLRTRQSGAGGAPTTLAQDSFTGSGALTAHTAETGGTWSKYWENGSSGDASLINNIAKGGSTPQRTQVYKLSTAAAGDLSATFRAWPGTGVPDTPTGLALRITGTNNAYLLGTTDLIAQSRTVYRLTNGALTAIASYSSGDGPTRFRAEVSGSSPTSIKLKGWVTTEGGSWDITTSDSTAANQTASGGVGVSFCTGDDGEGGPVPGQVDDLLVQTIGGGGGDFTAPTIDAWLKKTISASFTVNAVLKRNVGGTFTTDAVLRKSQSGSFTANAVLKAPSGTKTFSVDAIVKANSGTKSLTSDAVLRRTQTATFLIGDNVDPGGAWIVLSSQTKSGNFGANAVLLRASGTQSFTANAVIRKTQAGTLTIDVVRKANIAATFTLDTVKRATQSGSFAANAIALRASGTKSLTADAVTLRAQSGSFSANAIILRKRWYGRVQDGPPR